MTEWVDFLSLCMLLAGYVVGLGAVTVIDLHGILSRRSRYWTETSARVHKVTRPLIWLGIGLVTIGTAIFYRGDYGAFIPSVHAALLALLILNGLFVSFRVTPFLLARESEGRASELLPAALQHKIAAAFAVSTIAWWGSLALLIWYVLGR